ncbi:MAG TPA: hypothetical protein VK666_09785 [Chryseolinea sp.]|nr:hypothetical protein [Chryseolinea sp.]
MKKRCLIVVGFICYAMVITSCEKGSLGGNSKHKRYDSLFLGISLGMEQKAFFDHCWKLNNEKVFTNGPAAKSVEYKLVDDFYAPVMMRFYPSFYRDKIYEMPVTFSYQGWAPWNKQFSSDSLLPHVLTMFKKWYGPDFKLLQHPRMGAVYIKMDGNRRINIFIRDDQFVQAVFTDLEMEREKKKEEENAPTN